jgi:hypothetical protein
MKFRKKPIVIEAMCWEGTDDSALRIDDWSNGNAGRVSDEQLSITTLEGEMTASVGDWIIKGVKGEFYPCKPDIFAATYEPAN